MTKKIVIDSGHGGKDPGAVGNGLQEKAIVLSLSKSIKSYLESNYTGHEIKLTRTTDVFIELSERSNIANRFDADVFISNHVNAGGGTGYESFIYTKPSTGSIKLQEAVNKEAIATAKKYDLGVHGTANKRGDLSVIRQTKMPAVLTEIAFIDSKDASLLKKDAFLEDMAAAYARGIANYLDLPSKKAKPASVGEYYTVSKGDTVSAIAKKYSTTIQKIKKWNDLDKEYTIFPKQKLKVK